jgi:hypothetical protein
MGVMAGGVEGRGLLGGTETRKCASVDEWIESNRKATDTDPSAAFRLFFHEEMNTVLKSKLHLSEIHSPPSPNFTFVDLADRARIALDLVFPLSISESLPSLFPRSLGHPHLTSPHLIPSHHRPQALCQRPASLSNEERGRKMKT